MLYSRKELLDLKTKSLKRLQEGKLTKRQEVEYRDWETINRPWCKLQGTWLYET